VLFVSQGKENTSLNCCNCKLWKLTELGSNGQPFTTSPNSTFSKSPTNLYAPSCPLLLCIDIATWAHVRLAGFNIGQRSGDMQSVPRSLQSTAQPESNAPQLIKAKTFRLHSFQSRPLWNFTVLNFIWYRYKSFSHSTVQISVLNKTKYKHQPFSPETVQATIKILFALRFTRNSVLKTSAF
jgi:hypothetical protein